MWNKETFRVMHVDLASGRAKVLEFGERSQLMGGSGLCAALFSEYGRPDLPWDAPEQPLLFAIGSLTGFFPLMSKVVCGFVSPYTGQYAESHAGGRLALTMRFAGFEALMITGRASSLCNLAVGSQRMDIYDVHWLRGKDVFTTGKLLRRVGRGSSSGHRSIMRIGPAGEKGCAYACINVDTYRHFGRLGCGSVMGKKNLKAITVLGDADFDLEEGRGRGKEYANLFQDVFKLVTATDMMKKYHDLGTPSNLNPLNELKALPWRNLQQTTDPGVEAISGERFAEHLLLRQTACSGCPVGCIHIGLLRHQYASQHEFLYKQVNYDYESIFSQGSMLGMTSDSDVLALLDETEKQGLDVMSAGVALAWATEALDKGIVNEEQTLTRLRFGDVNAYLEGLYHLGQQPNEFYQVLAQGALHAGDVYGGADFACVLGQEMAGYATGEVFFTAQAMGFRHSHLDTGGYSFDQKHEEKDAAKAVDFLVSDEAERLKLTSMVSCLFARGVYTHERLQEALTSIGYGDVADNLDAAAQYVQQLRWSLKRATGYETSKVRIPKRFTEVVTWKGGIDAKYLEELRSRYGAAINELADEGDASRRESEAAAED